MFRATRPIAIALVATTLFTGCTHTAEILKTPGEEFARGDWGWGLFTLCAVPIVLPFYMLADVFTVLDISEEDVAAVGQVTQDYVTARAQQDAAQAQAQAQAQQALLQQQQQQWQAQQQAQQQQQQQRQQQQQQQQQQQATWPPPQAPAQQQGPTAQQQYAALQQERADAANAQVRETARQQELQREQQMATYAQAANCLSLIPRNQSLYGGFRNSCSYPVYYKFCNSGATGDGLGNFSDAFDCSKGQFGLDGVAANGTQGSHTNAPRTYWAACKQPYTPDNVRYTGSGVTYNCRK